jgi:hypothetical protein
MSQARARLSQEEVDLERDLNAERMIQARARLSQEEVDLERETNSQQRSAARANRTQEQIDLDNQAAAQGMKNTYTKRKARQHRIQAFDDSEFRLSAFNLACKHCGALHFAEEQVQDPRKKASFNDCCGHGRIFLEQPPMARLSMARFFSKRKFSTAEELFQ